MKIEIIGFRGNGTVEIEVTDGADHVRTAIGIGPGYDVLERVAKNAIHAMGAYQTQKNIDRFFVKG